jgi:hypothetical protein
VITFDRGLLAQSTMRHTDPASPNMRLSIKAPVFAGVT